MTVVAVCGLLLLLGLAGIARWGGRGVDRIDPEEGSPRLSAGDVGRRYLRYVVLAVVSGVGSGVLIAGAGGRLVMRLLAVTAGDGAQGRTTEADEIVGRITVSGTISFVAFTALFFGSATGALYLLIRRWLPSGRLGGLTYGVLLLVLAGTRLEPLRADNPDFSIVGPGWVAVVAFSALVLAHGMLVAALAGRYSLVVRLPTRQPRSWIAYGPLVLVAPLLSAVVLLALVGAVTVVLSQWLRWGKLMASPRTRLGGRLVLGTVSLVAVPTSLSAVFDIATRNV